MMCYRHSTDSYLTHAQLSHNIPPHNSRLSLQQWRDLTFQRGVQNEKQILHGHTSALRCGTVSTHGVRPQYRRGHLFTVDNTTNPVTGLAWERKIELNDNLGIDDVDSEIAS